MLAAIQQEACAVRSRCRAATIATKNPYMYREDGFFVLRSRPSTIAAPWHRGMSPRARDFYCHDPASIMANRRLWKTEVWTPNGLHVDSDYSCGLVCLAVSV